MSNGEGIYEWATCKYFLQVVSADAVVAHNATTGLMGMNSWVGSAARAWKTAFDRNESFDAQRKKQLADGEQSNIVELEKIANEINRPSERGFND